MSANILQFVLMEDMPNRIRLLRTSVKPKLSLEALGRMVGVSRMTMSDLERGDIELTVSYMRRISRALNVRPTDLLHPDDNPEALSIEERALIERLRSATPEERATLERVTDAVLPSGQKSVA